MAAFSSIAAIGLGAASTYSSYKASKKAGALAETDLQFRQLQYDIWREIFGPIEENIGDFYQNLSGDLFVASGLEDQAQEYMRAQEQINETMAQRGISDDSGLAIDIQKELELDNARARAEIRTEAPLKAAALQADVVAQSRGVQLSAIEGVSTASRNLQARHDQTASNYAAAGGKLLNLGMGNIGGGGFSGIGKAISGLF